MPKKNAATDAALAEPSGGAVVQRYRAYGEARELGIHCIPTGYIEVEQLDDGSYRIASADAVSQEAPQADDPANDDVAQDGEPEPEAQDATEEVPQEEAPPQEAEPVAEDEPAPAAE